MNDDNESVLKVLKHKCTRTKELIKVHCQVFNYSPLFTEAFITKRITYVG